MKETSSHSSCIHSFSTYHYQICHLDVSVMLEFFTFIAFRPLRRSYRGKIILICDGTGFSYNEIYPLKLYRGTQIREIKTHVRGWIIGLLEDGSSVSGGKAYASEEKMAFEALKFLTTLGAYEYFVADKYYDSYGAYEKAYFPWHKA